jgi:hypothetical protein
VLALPKTQKSPQRELRAFSLLLPDLPGVVDGFIHAESHFLSSKIPGLKNNLLSVTCFFYHAVGIARFAFNKTTGGH